MTASTKPQELIVPNVHLPDGHNLVPTALWIGDGWLTFWSVRTPDGWNEPLPDFDHNMTDDDTLIPWPFPIDYATGDDFRAIGWQVEG